MTYVRHLGGLLAIVLLVPTLAMAQVRDRAAAGKAPAAPLGGGAVPAAAALMQVLDIDGDGTLSAKEIRAATKALKTLDANGDGKLTPDELTHKRGGVIPKDRAADAARRARAGAAARGGRGGAVPIGGGGVLGGARGGGFGNPGAGNPGAGNPGALGGVRAGSGRGLPMSARQMRGFDKNRDGKVSRQELPDQFWRLYARFDINRDGILDPIELQRAEKAIHR